MKKYKYRTEIQLRFSDIDSLGHANNAVYFTFMERARMNYFDDIIDKDIDWDNQGLIVAQAEINYLKPVFMKDKITVLTGLEKFGNTSFVLGYSIVRDVDGQADEVARGSTVIVCFSYKDQKAIPIPGDWKALIEKFEQSN